VYFRYFCQKLQIEEEEIVNFYDNFVKLCNSVGKSPSRVVLDIGGTKSAVTRWKNGSNPTDATAMKIAEYFGVSMQELTGEAGLGDMLYESARDNGLIQSPFKKDKPTAEVGDGLTANQRKLYEIAKSLPEEKVDLLLQLMKSMLGDG
jgi:transcriptional regulator with XRE-family HTH domain